MKNIFRSSIAVLLCIALCGCSYRGNSSATDETTAAPETQEQTAEALPPSPAASAEETEDVPAATTLTQETGDPSENEAVSVTEDISLPDGTWVDENGFVLSVTDGVIFTFDNNMSPDISVNADGSVSYGGTTGYPDSFDGAAAPDFSDAISGEWTVAGTGYGYNFHDGSMDLFYEGEQESVATYELDGYRMIVTIYGEECPIDIRVEYDSIYLIESGISMQLFRIGSDAEKEYLAENGMDPSLIIGTWYDSSDITEEWIFTADEVTIGGKSIGYTAEPQLYSIRLVINDEEYEVSPNEYNGTLYLVSDSENILLLSEDSERYKKQLLDEQVKTECAELLSRYPDIDGWMEIQDYGDIPFLADPDYIDEYAATGYFPVSTPEELASVCYYQNTQPATYFVIELKNDIDLSGYEWAPMGWASDHPFKGSIVGNGYTISGVTIDSDYSNIGFLGWATYCGVKDLNFVDSDISGRDNVGIVTGQSICCSYQKVNVSGSVTGTRAGSLVGYEANGTLKNCTADVIVNGEKFDFLSWNEREKHSIVIEDPVTITMDEDHTVHRPEVEGYRNLGWMVLRNGDQVLHRNAENELSYRYFSDSPGTYEIYLTAFVSGQYVPISNTVTYTLG